MSDKNDRLTEKMDECCLLGDIDNMDALGRWAEKSVMKPSEEANVFCLDEEKMGLVYGLPDERIRKNATTLVVKGPEGERVVLKARFGKEEDIEQWEDEKFMVVDDLLMPEDDFSFLEGKHVMVTMNALVRRGKVAYRDYFQMDKERGRNE